MQPTVQFHRAGVIAGGEQGHHQFARLGHGHPGLFHHAATAQPLLDKRRPARGEPLARRAALDHPGQNRVEPVHGVAGLARPTAIEALGALAQRRAEPRSGAQPFGLLPAHGHGHVVGALQALVDRAATGNQRVAFGHAVFVAGPVDLAVRGLQAEHKSDRPAHHGPVRVQKILAAADQIMMPDAGGDVGDKVALAAFAMLRHAVAIRRPPAPVGQLPAGEPLVGALGGRPLAADGQTHRRLDVIPGIGATLGRPGNFAAGALRGGNGGDGGSQKVAWKQPGGKIRAAQTACAPPGARRAHSARTRFTARLSAGDTAGGCMERSRRKPFRAVFQEVHHHAFTEDEV